MPLELLVVAVLLLDMAVLLVLGFERLEAAAVLLLLPPVLGAEAVGLCAVVWLAKPLELVGAAAGWSAA